jgi:hypothetical protein
VTSDALPVIALEFESELPIEAAAIVLAYQQASKADSTARAIGPTCGSFRRDAISLASGPAREP